ncbi:hypothetical protein [Georgenia sp. SUBG003]|uniref:hypothetical protein n=1 Tax=Georgenia sp. SUBG003 TaxID=1497974 RepID=UPI003AB82827
MGRRKVRLSAAVTVTTAARATSHGAASSANNDYYLPELLDVADGKLTITTTKGIAYSNTGATGLINQQDNTLGVGVDAAASNLEFTTTLNSPTAATSSAQAGLWFGPDDQNYVKLALIGSSSTGRQIQLSREINGLTANGSAAAPSADQVMVDLSQTTIGSQPVTLTMTVNTVNDVITGRYQIGDNPEQALGSLALPANYTDGSRLVRPIEDVTSFGGIFATKRNMPWRSVRVSGFMVVSQSSWSFISPRPL